MSAGGPLRRPDKDDTLEEGDPVEVSRTNGETVLGEVTAIIGVQGHSNVCVATTDGELVTVDDRVELVSGVLAKEARKQARGGDSD